MMLSEISGRQNYICNMFTTMKNKKNIFLMRKILEENKTNHCSFTFLFSKFSLGTYYICGGGKQILKIQMSYKR